MSKTPKIKTEEGPPFRIEPLSQEHVVEEFDCGEESLNGYLVKYGRWNASVGIGRTYVLVREGEMNILGYYTIVVGQLRTSDLPERLAKRLPKYPVPIIKVGRLATDRSIQGQGLGDVLLMDALLRAELIAEHAGVYAVEVDALNERAKTFYERYGFQSLTDDPLHMYLLIRAIRTLRR